jgi:hypothetical protein
LHRCTLVPADEYLFGFLLLTSILFFQFGSGCGLDVIKYPTCSNTWPLVAIYKSVFVKLRGMKLLFCSSWTISLIVVFSFCGNWTYQKHVTGNYFLVGQNKKYPTLCYQLQSGSFSGRVDRVVSYGFSDSVLVAKTVLKQSSDTFFHIINMRRDSDSAEDQNVRIGPVSKAKYQDDWSNKLSISFNNVE